MRKDRDQMVREREKDRRGHRRERVRNELEGSNGRGRRGVALNAYLRRQKFLLLRARKTVVELRLPKPLSSHRKPMLPFACGGGRRWSLSLKPAGRVVRCKVRFDASAIDGLPNWNGTKKWDDVFVVFVVSLHPFSPSENCHSRLGRRRKTGRKN